MASRGDHKGRPYKLGVGGALVRSLYFWGKIIVLISLLFYFL